MYMYGTFTPSTCTYIYDDICIHLQYCDAHSAYLHFHHYYVPHVLHVASYSGLHTPLHFLPVPYIFIYSYIFTNFFHWDTHLQYKIHTCALACVYYIISLVSTMQTLGALTMPLLPPPNWIHQHDAMPP